MSFKENIKQYILLACLPPLAKLLSYFIPIPYFGCIVLLYLMTIFYARYKCKTIDMKTLSNKTLSTLLVFIILDLFNYVLVWIPILNFPPLSTINDIINSIIGWFVIALFTYVPLFSLKFNC